MCGTGSAVNLALQRRMDALCTRTGASTKASAHPSRASLHGRQNRTWPQDNAASRKITRLDLHLKLNYWSEMKPETGKTTRPTLGGGALQVRVVQHLQTSLLLSLLTAKGGAEQKLTSLETTHPLKKWTTATSWAPAIESPSSQGPAGYSAA